MELGTLFVILLLIIVCIKLASILPGQKCRILFQLDPNNKVPPVNQHQSNNFFSKLKEIFRPSSKRVVKPPVNIFDGILKIGSDQKDPEPTTHENEPPMDPLPETYSTEDELEKLRKKREERDKKREISRNYEKSLLEKYNIRS